MYERDAVSEEKGYQRPKVFEITTPPARGRDAADGLTTCCARRGLAKQGSEAWRTSERANERTNERTERLSKTTTNQPLFMHIILPPDRKNAVVLERRRNSGTARGRHRHRRDWSLTGRDHFDSHSQIPSFVFYFLFFPRLWELFVQ